MIFIIKHIVVLFLNNPLFRKILKEELELVRTVINENYSADKIWSSMSEKDREDVLLASADDNGPDLANQYAAESVWDNVPADIQDTIDLSDYELANTDKGGRTNIRGLEYGLTEHPEAKIFVDTFLKKVGRASLKDITIKQSYALQPAFWTYVNSKRPQQQIQRNTQNYTQSGATEPSRDPFYKGGASWTGD